MGSRTHHIVVLCGSLFFLCGTLCPAVARAADSRKVLRLAFQSAESKLDPQAESDSGSGAINDNIFDALLQYDYLARPARLRPLRRRASELGAADGPGCQPGG